jgi:neutral trehalase
VSNELASRAQAILRTNDRGGYTVPTSSGLYPAQWNWDSCLVALGFAQYDMARAWQEVETLFSGQWKNGMVPSILFHGDDSTYFPNTKIWQCGDAVPSSGITQPAVAATVVRYLFERTNPAEAKRQLARLAPKLLASHRWFYAARDPDGTGLVSIIHPWESGMDNSPIWDDALADVPPGPSVAHLRKDTGFAEASVRPTGPEYDRYINLVVSFREAGYDPGKIWQNAPFLVADIGFNAILQRANHDLLHLLRLLEDTVAADEVARMIKTSAAALEARWLEQEGIYRSRNTRRSVDIAKPGIGCLLPLYADAGTLARHPALGTRLEEWLNKVSFGVPSFEPGRPEFEPRRYWRGPVWLVVNWMLIDGLRQNGAPDLAERVRRDSLALVERSGFGEYFDPLTGEALGGTKFSWTAAMYLLLRSL